MESRPEDVITLDIKGLFLVKNRVFREAKRHSDLGYDCRLTVGRPSVDRRDSTEKRCKITTFLAYMQMFCDFVPEIDDLR